MPLTATSADPIEIALKPLVPAPSDSSATLTLPPNEPAAAVDRLTVRDSDPPAAISPVVAGGATVNPAGAAPIVPGRH